MLCLSRHINESIIIGNNITITFLGMRGSEARLGITAPRDIPVHRQEVAEAIVRDGERKGASIMSDEHVTFSVDEALAMLPDGEWVHTFRGHSLMIEADWPRPKIVELITRLGGAKISHGMAARLNHGIVVDDGRPIYIETRPTS